MTDEKKITKGLDKELMQLIDAEIFEEYENTISDLVDKGVLTIIKD